MQTYDEAVERFISDYADGLGIDRHKFIGNVLIDFMARLTVMEESGRPANLFQFARGDDGEVLQGYDLFSFLVAYYKGERGLADARITMGFSGGARILRVHRPSGPSIRGRS